MSRTIIRLALGGALLLIAAACASQPTAENAANVESLEPASSDPGNTESQSPDGKPVVTVSRSPT